MSATEDPRPADADADEAQTSDEVKDFVEEVEQDPASNPPKELDDIRGG